MEQRSSRPRWIPISSDGPSVRCHRREIENLRKACSAGTIEADWTNLSPSTREDPPHTGGDRGEVTPVSPSSCRAGGAGPNDHLVRGTGRGRWGQLCKGSEGSFLSRVVWHPGRWIRRRLPH